MIKHADVSSTGNVLHTGLRVPAAHAAGFPAALGVCTPDNADAFRWWQITGSLGACGGASECMERRVLSSWDRAPGDGYALNATIEILDRPSPVSAFLSWRDPTSCSYGYQAWRKTVARRTGICALSGGRVRRGDAIFRPALRGTRPSNASAMILAVCIECPHQLVTRRPYRE